MSAALRIICEPDLAPGFALAGIAADTATRETAADTGLDELIRRREAVIVLLQDQLYDALLPELRARLDRSATPVVVPFPGPTWAPTPSAEDRIVELLRRAIGYRVKLR